MKPHIIGIAGPSSSGKTELSRQLVSHWPGTAIVSLDSYYREMGGIPLEIRAKTNFDHPDALEWELLKQHLSELVQGRAFEEPVYSFAHHTRTGETKRISLYGVVEFCLWNAMDDMTNFQRNFSTGEVEVEPGAIYHVTEYRERRNHYAVWAVNRETDGFDTDREAFFGLYNGFDAPDAVLKDQTKNSVASGWSPIGAYRVCVTLAPGEETSLIFILGYLENPEAEKFVSPGVVNKAPAAVPRMVPVPPKRLVPPMITAAITNSS
jgi:hypothetical protein